MGLDLHTLDVLSGSSPTAQPDRVTLVYLPARANAAAAGAGDTVTVAVTGLTLPAAYAVFATPSQPCSVSFASKSQTGFDVILTPLSSGTTLAAGTVDIIVLA